MGDVSASETQPLKLNANRATLPIWEKSAYGFGSIGLGIMQSSIWMFLMFFYTDVIRLTSGLAGVALAVGRFWDAFSDPLMGQITDRTRSPLGRRRPYVIFGSIFWGMIFIALWFASPEWNTPSKFAYLMAMDVLFTTGLTIVNTPYFALGAELSSDYTERTKVVAYRLFFFYIGNIIGAGLLPFADRIQLGSLWLRERGGALLQELDPLVALLAESRQASWIAAASIICGVGVIAMMISGIVPKERFATRAMTRIHLFQAVKTTLKNRNFLRVLGADFFATLAGQLGVPLLPYLFIYWLKQPTFMMFGFMTMAITQTVALPMWIRVARHIEKRTCFRIACFFGMFAGPLSLLTLNPQYPWLMFPWLVYGGFIQAGVLTFSQSMIADVADEDELVTGERREGMYFGVYTFSRKLIASFGMAWAGIALALVSYVPDAEQTARTLWSMRLLYAANGLGYIGGLILLRHFLLTRTRIAEIQDTVRRRNEQREE